MLVAVTLGVTPEARAEEPVDLGAAARAAGTVNGLCPVMQRPVRPNGGSATYAGEKVGFCCPGCDAKFNADPVRYMNRMRLNAAKFAYTSIHPTRATMRAAAAAAGSANGRCPVMGRPVTANGGSVMVGEQRIAFCCLPCVEKFNANVEGYMRLLRADPLAYGYARPGLTHAQLRMKREAAGSVNGLCPVMGKPVTPRGGSAMHRGEQIGFCCPGCDAKFRADPESYMSLLRTEPAVYGYLPGLGAGRR
jgi:YHS domain-containing protein